MRDIEEANKKEKIVMLSDMIMKKEKIIMIRQFENRNNIIQGVSEKKM